VARLRFLHQMRSHSAMLGFRIGERVKFHPDGRPVVFGTLTRYNKKTVTVVTDAGENWNVAPGLLSKAESRSARKANEADAGWYRFQIGQRNRAKVRLKEEGQSCRLP